MIASEENLQLYAFRNRKQRETLCPFPAFLPFFSLGVYCGGQGIQKMEILVNMKPAFVSIKDLLLLLIFLLPVSLYAAPGDSVLPNGFHDLFRGQREPQITGPESDLGSR